MRKHLFLTKEPECKAILVKRLKQFEFETNASGLFFHLFFAYHLNVFFLFSKIKEIFHVN